LQSTLPGAQNGDQFKQIKFFHFQVFSLNGKKKHEHDDPFYKHLLFLSNTFFDFSYIFGKNSKQFLRFLPLFSKIPLFAPTLTIFPKIRTQKHVDLESLKKIGRWS